MRFGFVRSRASNAGRTGAPARGRPARLSLWCSGQGWTRLGDVEPWQSLRIGCAASPCSSICAPVRG